MRKASKEDANGIRQGQPPRTPVYFTGMTKVPGDRLPRAGHLQRLLEGFFTAS
jgi:hypothetical protein